MALTERLAIYDNTLGAVLRFKKLVPPGDTRFDAVPLRFEVKLDPQAHMVLKANPLIKQQIQLDMIPLVANVVGAMPPPAPNQGYDGLMKSRVETLLKACEPQVDAVMTRALDRCAETNAAWSKYYKAQRKELIFAAVGLGLSAVGIASGVASGGASIPIALVGAARALVTGITKMLECYRSAEEYQKRITANIKLIADAYAKSTHAGRAMQIGGSALSATGVTPAIELFMRRDLLPNVGKIKADMDIYKGKLANLYITANKLTVQLFDLLDQQEAWHKANPHVSLDDEKTFPALTKLWKKINELLEAGKAPVLPDKTGFRKIEAAVRTTHGIRGKVTISSAYERYEVGMAAYKILQDEFQKLQNLENNPKAVNIAVNVVKVLVNIAFTLANYQQALNFAADPTAYTVGTQADKIAQAMGVFGQNSTQVDTVPVVIGTALGWTGDILGTGKDGKDLATEVGLTPEHEPAIANYQQQLESAYDQLPDVVPPPRPPRPSGTKVARPVKSVAVAPASPAPSHVPASPVGSPTPPPRPPRPAPTVVLTRRP